MNGPHVEISGVATLCFDEEGTWFQGSITAEDDAQYAIYGTKSLRKRSGTGEELFWGLVLFLLFCLFLAGLGREMLTFICQSFIIFINNMWGRGRAETLIYNRHYYHKQ